MNEMIAGREVWVDCLVVLYGPGMEMAAAKNVTTLGETVMRECLAMVVFPAQFHSASLIVSLDTQYQTREMSA